MLLNKIHRTIMSFIVARTIQGTFATPVSQGSGSGLISRDAPEAFFYDPRYMPALDALTIPAEGKCNMLISKKDVGQDSYIFAFPACNLPPSETVLNKDMAVANLTHVDEELYGELFLLEHIPRDEDAAKLVSGLTLSVLREEKAPLSGVIGVLGTGITKWRKISYGGNTDFNFKNQKVSLLGPYPNPYRLLIGGNFPTDKSLTEVHLPLKTNFDESTTMFIYDAPPA